MPERTSALFEMGIRNPDQITSYSHVHPTDHIDQLRIVYARPAGSLLPRVRTYDFPRTSVPNTGAHVQGNALIHYEIAPILEQALEELSSLLTQRKRNVAVKETLLREIADLRTEMETRIAHLMKLANSLPGE